MSLKINYFYWDSPDGASVLHVVHILCN